MSINNLVPWAYEVLRVLYNDRQWPNKPGLIDGDKLTALHDYIAEHPDMRFEQDWQNERT